MQWLVHEGDLLDVPADVLICAANVYLNLSGGVGGAFLLRYGSAMQTALRAFLTSKSIHFVQRGEVIAMPPCGSHYRAVLHAVAVDGAYESSPKVIAEVVAEGLRQAAGFDAQCVALAALATGYGRLPLGEFAEGLKSVIDQEFPPLEQVVIGLRSKHDVDELTGLIPEIVAI